MGGWRNCEPGGIGQYHMTVQHRQGVKHGNADGLSRIPAELPCPGFSTEVAPKPEVWRVQGQASSRGQDLDEIHVSRVMILVADGNVIFFSRYRGEMSIQVVQDEYGVGLGKYAVDEICESQGKDPELKWLVKGLKGEGDLSQGEIFRSSPHAKFYWVNRSRFTMTDREEVILIPTKGENPRLVVPMEWRNENLELCHDIPSAGHQGAERTREKIKQSYYWHGLGADVERNFVRCTLWTLSCHRGELVQLRATGKLLLAGEHPQGWKP
ncbi:unnamed protein product [Mytilus coruscus]|uniref:Integrase zinc-binding domain-containing protein n=1 Tax=Mytilus coruscus TaxID=42192 RepID=A0A6J8B1N3_MYTCO|nr:unnamed protein product [Mytilus coruscus]